MPDNKSVNYVKLNEILDNLTEQELAILLFTAQAIFLEREYMYKISEVMNE